MAADYIHFTADGKLHEIIQTKQGVGSYDGMMKIEAENFGETNGITKHGDRIDGINVQLKNNDFVVFRNVNFANKVVNKIQLKLATNGSRGVIEICDADTSENVFAQILVPQTASTQSWETISSGILNMSGVKNIMLKFKTNDVAFLNIDWFNFIQNGDSVDANYYKELTLIPSALGTISVSPEGINQPINSVVTLTAKPTIGYCFDSWGGDVTGKHIETTLKMDAGKTVSVNFEKTYNFAINCGGNQYIAADGTLYAQTPAGYSKSNTITGTADQIIYQSERYSKTPFSSDLAVDNGNYTVNLKFAEIYFTDASKRVFNVNIEGVSVLTNYDIFVEAGGAYKAIDKTFNTTVTDGVFII